MQAFAAKLVMACAALAATLGTVAVLWIDNRVLRAVVPWLLLAVAIHVLRRPNLGDAPTEARLSANRFGALAGGAFPDAASAIRAMTSSADARRVVPGPDSALYGPIYDDYRSLADIIRSR